MPRKPLIRSAAHPYHVTARANNREPFKLDLESCWRVFMDHLVEIEEIYQVKIHAFVLMNNHFHLLLSTPTEDLGVIMQNFMRSVTRSMNSKSKRTGRVFGARYHWSLVHSIEYYDSVVKYVYRNPVKAGLTEFVEDYHFSTLKSLVNNTKSRVNLCPPFSEKEIIPAGEIGEYLRWLNQAFRNEDDEKINAGLKKTEFSPPLPKRKRAEVREDFIQMTRPTYKSCRTP